MVPRSVPAASTLAEQLVAGADEDGDVLVILGTTLIVWAVTSREEPVPDHYVIPHTAAGKTSSADQATPAGCS
jgi:xylulokinase